MAQPAVVDEGGRGMRSLAWRLALIVAVASSILLGTVSGLQSADRHAPPPERWVSIKFEHEVPNALVGWFKQILGTDYSVIHDKDFFYAAVKLNVNDKSTQDLIMYMGSPGFCGSGGCIIYVEKFNAERHSYTNFGAFQGTAAGPEAAFASTVTNGYRDLIIDKADLLVFDGTQYVLTGGSPEGAVPRASHPEDAAPQASPSQGAAPRFSFETEGGAILCHSSSAIKEAKAALTAHDKSWFEKTGCVQAAGGLRVVLIEAPLAPSRMDGSPTPSSDLPWRVRVYSPDIEAEGANVDVDPWQILTYAWATIAVPLSWMGPGHLSPGEKPIQFRSGTAAERWYAQNILPRDKPYVRHKVIDDGNGTFRLLLGPTAYGLLQTICSGGKPSCYLVGHLPY